MVLLRLLLRRLLVLVLMLVRLLLVGVLLVLHLLLVLRLLVLVLVLVLLVLLLLVLVLPGLGMCRWWLYPRWWRTTLPLWRLVLMIRLVRVKLRLRLRVRVRVRMALGCQHVAAKEAKGVPQASQGVGDGCGGVGDGVRVHVLRSLSQRGRGWPLRRWVQERYGEVKGDGEELREEKTLHLGTRGEASIGGEMSI